MGMEKKNIITRRSFFSGLGLVAAAGVAIKVSQTVSMPKAITPAQDDPGGDGYRLTEHVKKYYRTTTI
jgi:hypothetical protein